MCKAVAGYYLSVFQESPSTCGGENPADDATKPDKELPERHVLLCDLYHEWADVILHKDPWDSMTAGSMVDRPILQNKSNTNGTAVHLIRTSQYRARRNVFKVNLPAQSQSTDVSLQTLCWYSVWLARWWWSIERCDWLGVRSRNLTVLKDGLKKVIDEKK